MTMRYKFISFFLLILTHLLTAAETIQFSIDTEQFPIPNVLTRNINFWISVFSEYSQDQAIIHDKRDFYIYEVIDVGKLRADTLQSTSFIAKKIAGTRREYQNILAKLARTRKVDVSKLTPREKRVYQLFKGEQTAHRFRMARRSIRLQYGLREEFLFGIVRSGKYFDEMKRIFNKYALPEELTCLPHVESSFQHRIYSRVGAAGMWQFTYRTGKRFLKINKYVDERIDPFYATEAAAKLLKENYRQLDSWPLAITAYNHGCNGMLRAKRIVGSADFGTILKKYRSRSFRFASRNFYAEFIAAVHVRNNYHQYFGEVFLSDPVKFSYFNIPSPLEMNELAQILNLNLEIIKQYNPSIRSRVYKNALKLPKGLRIRVPEIEGVDWAEIYANIAGWNPETRPGMIPYANPGTTSETPAISVFTDADAVDLEDDAPLAPLIKEPALASPPKSWKPMDIKPVKTPEASQNTANVIVVQPEETLGHYADWLQVPTQELRRINRLRPGRDIYIGQKIKLIFKNTTPELFYQRRTVYHTNIQEHFYNSFQITGVKIHQIQPGENIWSLCRDVYSIPYWLLLKYNAHLELAKLKHGDEVIFPLVCSISEKKSTNERSGG